MASVPGKWIDGLTPEMSSRAAARLVLDVRLEAVETSLPLAAERPDETIEHVHRLRVSTRRAGAAARLFGRCLPRKRRDATRIMLREIRQAAGVARVCDVHGVLLARRLRRADGDAAFLLDAMIELNRSARGEAQAAIVACAEHLDPDTMQRARAKLIESVRHPKGVRRGDGRHPTPLRKVAAKALPKLVRRVRRAAAADLHCIDNVHQLRITGKRLRYGLEVFRCCFESGFDKAYTSLTALQDELGDINDVFEIRGRLDGDLHLPASGPSDEAFRHELECEMATLLKSFHKKWDRGDWTPLLERLARLEHPSGKAPLSLADRVGNGKRR